MRRVFWDTMIFAYFLEHHPRFHRTVFDIYSSMVKRGDVLCSSPLVMGELMVNPLRFGDSVRAADIETFFHSEDVALLQQNDKVIRLFAELRAKQKVSSIDALHLATAGVAGVDVFLTNDYRLQKIHVPGISFIAPLDAALF